MKQTLGQKLRMLRALCGYTQEELSVYLFLGRSTYANYENDRRLPSHQCLMRIADFYAISVDTLIRSDNSSSGIAVSENAPAFSDFCQLTQEGQSEVGEYIRYRLLRQLHFVFNPD